KQATAYNTQSNGGARKRRVITSPVLNLFTFIIALISTIFLILPIAMIFLLAFSVNGSWRTAPLPSQYTTENFIGMFQNPKSWEAITNSLAMSGIAVGGAIVLGLASAYVIARMRLRWKPVIDTGTL